MTRTIEPLAPYEADELGPIATFGAQVFVFFTVIFAFQVTGFEVFPGVTPLLLGAGMAGVVVLAPRRVMRRVPISLLVLAMLGIMAASVIWTANPAATSFALRRDLPLLIGMLFAVGTISLKDLVPALLWSIRVSIAISLVAVAVFETSRTHIDPSGQIPELEGWHGLFPHKNIMTPFLVFGILTILTFDRTIVMKWGSLVLAGVLLAGSDSVTGMISALLAVSIWIWFQLFQNLDVRGSTIFFFSSLSVAFFGVIGLIVSVSSLVAASGKDLTFTGRTFIWQATIDAAAERPILGYGMNAIFFDDPIIPKTAEVWRAVGFQVPHAHNGFLNLAVQLGIVGLIVFLALFFTTLGSGVRTLGSQPQLASWIVSTMVVQLFIALSEAAFVSYGWLLVVVMFRVLLMRRTGMELDKTPHFAEKLGATSRRPARGLASVGIDPLPR